MTAAGIRQQTLSQLLQRPIGQLHSAGLALSLVQDVVAAHGGDVQLESGLKRTVREPLFD